MTCNNLAVLMAAGGQYALAEALYQRALTIFTACLAPTHPNVLACRQNYAHLVRETEQRAAAPARTTRTRGVRRGPGACAGSRAP